MKTKKQSDMVNARKIFLRQFSALGSVREESMIDFEGLTLKLGLIIWALVRGKLFEEFRVVSHPLKASIGLWSHWSFKPSSNLIFY